MTKIIVVTGGVVSSLGKGIAAASLGLLLKARMLNETMIRLAEKGVITSSDALEALAGSKQAAAAVSAAAAVTPLQEQARQLRRRAAWSDLRKGVFTAGVGVALGHDSYSVASSRFHWSIKGSARVATPS